MSYSFNVRGATKDAAKAMVAAELDKVAAMQHCHAADKAQAERAAASFIDILPEDADKDVVVNMSGSLSGIWTGSDITRITGANVSIYASLSDRL